MFLSDGRKIVPAGSTSDDMSEIVCHPDFRAIFLANRPGFPFLGNDFYAVMGDLLSCHAVDNPDPDSELVRYLMGLKYMEMKCQLDPYFIT